jgi:Reverse transcriptase (RNA-dependent DNA polymerase)
MTQPEGFLDVRSLSKVLHLIKLLYRLKQAPRIWYLFLYRVIVGLGFVPLETDLCIYKRSDIIAVIYVDDIIVAALTIEQCNAVYNQLKQHIAAENKGLIKSFLSIDIIRN